MNRKIKGAGVRLVVLLILMGTIGFLSFREMRRNREPVRPGELPLQVRSIRVTHDLALGSFVIPAGSTHDVKIPIDGNRMHDPHLGGHFRVQSGSAIEVELLDEDQYSKFRKDTRSASFIYVSGKTKDGYLDSTIPQPGLFYLIFDNSSESSPATVEADVTLRYITVRVKSGAEPKQ